MKPILVVDDDSAQRDGYRELLQDEGYVVIEAADGRQALHYLVDETQTTPCLILLDLTMPIMDGWEFLAILKSYVRLHAIPVVLISGEEPRLDPVRHGTIAAHLRKPYDVDELLRLAATYGGGCRRQ